MNKKNFAYVAFVALVSAATLVSCNKKEDEPSAKAPSVTTDIALSLPSQVVGGGARRMPAGTVQTSGATDFATNGMNNITLVPFGPSAAVTTSSVRLGDNITLGAIGDASRSANTATGNAKVFESENVPLGTSAFLFYGVSGKTGNGFQAGVLNASLAGQPSAFTFSLQPINANASDVANNAAYKNLIKYLNTVANANDGTKAWKNYDIENGDNEGLYDMFQSYSTATVLSSFNIQRMMTDLYQSLMKNPYDAMAAAIRDSIADARYATVNTTTGAVTLASGLTGFPANVKLPEGAVAVAYNTSTKVFDGNAAHAYGGLNPAAVDRYVYPAQLWYYSNSKIKTSVKSKLDEYTGTRSWQSILDTYEKNDGSVNTKTRSIAIKDTVQYAVARLDVKVKTKEGSWLVDNDSVAANNKVNNPASGWQLTAVLVGGQKNVGFDFTQATYGGSITYAYTIYDSIMSSTIYAQTADYSAANSTLVLETPASENEYIALEFVNSSAKDFYGVDGIVPIGGKFYLVGQLLAADATETANHVFKQDYTTTAKVAIKDLKHAYSTIPDLKSPSLEIGLSIDLTWQNGHEYELEL